MQADEILQHKAPYLNTTFFIVRAVLYFAELDRVCRCVLNRLSLAAGHGRRRAST